MTQKIYVDKCRVISLTNEGLLMLTPTDDIILIQPEITEKIFETITRFKASPNTAYAGTTYSEHISVQNIPKSGRIKCDKVNEGAKPKRGYATGGVINPQAELFGDRGSEVIVSVGFIESLFKRIGILEEEWPVGTRNAPVWKASRKRDLPLTEMDIEHIENTIAWLKKRRQNIHKEMSYVNSTCGEEYYGAVIEYWRDWEDKFEAELKRRNVR